MSNLWSFQSFAPALPDPIFAITAEAIAAGSKAINGTIGVFMDEEGKPVVFPSTRLALTELQQSLPMMSYSYPPLLGLAEFRAAVTNLIFSAINPPFVASIAATAGTGAIALNLRLVKNMQPETTVILPAPAWANHLPVCNANFLHVTEVPYIDATGKASIDAIIEACEKATRPICVLLQVGCHNPTGLNFTAEQWTQLANYLEKKDCIVLLDFAYQGFEKEPEEDASVITLFVQKKIPTLVAWSASKNHSIYGMRCGFTCAITESEALKQKIEVHYSRITRGMHSAAPTFGQSIVALVQTNYKDQWKKDLKSARATVNHKRGLMKEALPETFKTALDGHGMFAMLPLSVDQIRKLKIEQHVFCTEDGRINIAGIPLARIPELCEKIMAVLL